MFRWGILSTAKIGREHVIPAILASRNGVLSAISSRDRARAEVVAQHFGCPVVLDSYEEILTCDGIDGIYIPLPTSHHIEWARKSLNAGKHILVEKPVAMDAGDVAELISLRDSTGLCASEAFMVVYHPQWQMVRDLVSSGAIGRLLLVEGCFTNHNVDPDNMRNKMELGGGGLRDIGVYPTVTTRFVTGMEPTRVQAHIDRDPVFGTDRFAFVRADFAGAFEMKFYIATQVASRQSMIFHGDSGYIEVAAPFNAELYDDPRVTVFDREHKAAQVYRFPSVNQYQLQVEVFADAVASRDHTKLFSLESSSSNQRVIDAIFRAGEHHGWEAV